MVKILMSLNLPIIKLTIYFGKISATTSYGARALVGRHLYSVTTSDKSLPRKASRTFSEMHFSTLPSHPPVAPQCYIHIKCNLLNKCFRYMHMMSSYPGRTLMIFKCELLILGVYWCTFICQYFYI